MDVAPVVDSELNRLADNIAALVSEAKAHLARSANVVMLASYWNIGKYIVEFEQEGNAKAKYGTALLSSLSKILRAKLGKGYSHPNLNNMRKFYLLYPNFQTVSEKLSWSHIIDLKKNAVRHQDIGQMNMYLGYFAKEESASDDNPPIGIILSHIKDELLVEYATYGMDSKLFVSKYELYLPNKDELRRLVDDVVSDGLNKINKK